jgi:tripartite ATP-independent transporter DctM subunit
MIGKAALSRIRQHPLAAADHPFGLSADASGPGNAGTVPDGSAVATLAGQLLHILESSLNLLLGLVLALLLLVVCCSVLARYTGCNTLSGTEELAAWLYVAIIFLGFPLVPYSPLAMRFDSLSRKLRGGWRNGVDIFGHAVVLHAALLLIAAGSGVIRDMGGVSVQLGLPEWYRFALAPPAGALACLITILRLVSARRPPLFILASMLFGFALFLFGQASLLVQIGLPSAAAAAFAVSGLFLGAPLPHVLLSSLALVIPLGSLLPEPAILQNTVLGAGSFLLLAIPFFILAGGVMSATALAGKLVALADALVGHRRGGLAQTALLTNVFFSGISGSSMADVAFGVKVLGPGLRERGYTMECAAAIISATSVLPNIIPPSVAFLMLAVATDLSVSALFTGGLIAGLFLALVLAAALYRISPEKTGRAPASAGVRVKAVLEALPVLGLAAIILLGIRFGIVTVTEASAVAAVYALAISVAWFVSTGGNARSLAGVFARTGRETASIGLLIGASTPFMFILAVDEAPAALSAFLGSMGGGPFAFLLAANVILLLFGLCLEVGVGIVLLAPLLLPAAVNAGVDPVQFGVILVVNLMLGSLTPPVGMIVFVAGGLCGVSSGKVFRAVMPLLFAMLLALAVMTVTVGIRASF